MGKTGKLISVRFILMVLLMGMFAIPSYGKIVSITQLGFMIKKILPNPKTIPVLYPAYNKDMIKRDAKMAYTILRKKIMIYDISREFEIVKKINRISRLDNVSVIVITDKNMFSTKTIKFISKKLMKNKIPLFTNRKGDTGFEAFVCMFYNEKKKLETHINKSQMQKLDVTVNPVLLEKFIVK